MLIRPDARARVLWWYGVAVLVAWVVTPELRRVLDWRLGFHATQVLAALPLLGVGLFAFVTAFGGVGAVSQRMVLLVWLWMGTFIYGCAMGLLVGRGRSAIYDVVAFIAPVFMALWIAGRTEGRSAAFNRTTTVILAIASGVGVYGILQFVAPPPWDVFWMHHVTTDARMSPNGNALPFQVRVFSLLNSPEPCAAFLSTALALNLYRLKDGRILPLAGMFVCVVALTLTLVRSAWIALIVAVAVYLLFSWRPVRAASVVMIFGIVIGTFFTFISPWLAAEAGQDSIAQRLQTFVHLDRDRSARARTVSTAELVNEALAYPTGEGLGLIGTATQLTSVTQSINSIDGGVQARLVELGFVGFVGYLATLLLAFTFVLHRWWEARQGDNHAEIDVMAAILAVQALLIVLDLSIDSHANLAGALFWITVGIALSRRAGPALVTSPRIR